MPLDSLLTLVTCSYSSNKHKLLPMRTNRENEDGAKGFIIIAKNITYEFIAQAHQVYGVNHPKGKE